LRTLRSGLRATGTRLASTDRADWVRAFIFNANRQGRGLGFEFGIKRDDRLRLFFPTAVIFGGLARVGGRGALGGGAAGHLRSPK